jgi:Tol biopolymer transport system component
MGPIGSLDDRRFRRLSIMPLIGGGRRLFLGDSASSPAWSPDGTALVYVNAVDGDPLFVADRTGPANAREIFRDKKGIHNHSPVWSPDGQWIYFVHGRPDTGDTALYRIRPAGGSAEQLIDSQSSVTSVAPLDPHTLLYAASSTGPSGERLWALDLDSRKSRPVTTGFERYLTVAASADGRNIVATVVANPDARLWSLPLGDEVAGDRDVQVFRCRAHARSSLGLAEPRCSTYLPAGWRMGSGISRTGSSPKSGKDRTALCAGLPPCRETAPVSPSCSGKKAGAI